MSHRFSIDANYTFSKVLANRYTTADANQNWIYNLNGSYGVAENNHPQRVVAILKTIGEERVTICADGFLNSLADTAVHALRIVRHLQ